MKKRSRSWWRYEPIRASDNARQTLAGMAVTVGGLIAVLLVTNASEVAKGLASVGVLIVAAFVAYWLLHPAPYFCYVVADTTDMSGDIPVSPKLWIHAEGYVPPGSGFVSPWGSRKGANEYKRIGLKIPWTMTSANGFDTGERLPPGDYSIDFTALGHLNWEERLTIYWEDQKLKQTVLIIPANGKSFSPEIYEH